MIERRRLFFRSDFLRGITHPALFCTVQFACALSRNNGIMFAKANCHAGGGTKPNSARTGLIEIRLLDLVLFATFAFLICYVYQINWDWLHWGHAFGRKRIGRELRARRCR